MSEALEAQVKLLETQKKAIENQLDKVTADLFKMQDAAAELQNKLDEKKHTEQLAGWAIDRAIETAKLNEIKPDAAAITTSAQTFCDWIKNSSVQPNVSSRGNA